MINPSDWRLVITPPAAGSWNMAVDEAILENVSSKRQRPTLRLFAWEPPCLSLGYAQNRDDVDDDALYKNGWGLVRRPTGGRAILHTDELTYSIAAASDEPRVMGSVLESYCRLSKALLEALMELGIEATAHEIEPGKNNKPLAGPVCFEEPSNYEITWNSKKLIGSAQTRRMNGVLQHGSLPLYGNLERIVLGLYFPDEKERQKAAARLLDHAATVESVLGRKVSWQEAANAFILGFTEALSINLIPSEISNEENIRAMELVDQKFGNPSWTDRV